MIKNQFQVAETIDNPIMFSDDDIDKYKKGANPMVDPRTAEAEQNRRELIRNLVQGMLARNNVGAQQQQGGGQMPTIVEVEKQKMAQQQAMQQQLIDALTNAGVGSLPTKPGMFSQGGGVVAFNGEDEQQLVSSPEETSPPSDGGGKSVFQRLGDAIRPKNTYLQRPDNAVADQAIEIIKQVKGQIGYGDVADIRDGRFGSSVEAITQRLLGKPVSPPRKANQAEVRNAEKDGPSKEDTKTDSKPSGEGGGGRQGIASLSSRLDPITKETKKISEELAKETEGEKLLFERIKSELERTEKYKDLSEEQLDKIAQKRLDQMKAESDPLFQKMKANIAERKGETVGMTPEERREAFIARLGKRGRGWANMFGESLEGDVLQKAKDRDLNRARQDALAKEEMELARAEMLEARGQRKEADEARKLALQAHRDAENLRRQQAQTEIGGVQKLAEGERKRKELAYKPRQEELRALREEVMKQYDIDQQNIRAAQQADRLNRAPEEAKYNFYYKKLIDQGVSPEEAKRRAFELATKGQEERTKLTKQELAAKNPEYKALVQQRAMFGMAAANNPDMAKRVKQIDDQITAIEAKYGIGSGGAPTGKSISWNDIPG